MPVVSASSDLAAAGFHEAPVVLADRIIFLRRTEKRFENAVAVRNEQARLEAALDELGRASHKLLIDVRSAPLQATEHLSLALQDLRNSVRSGFAAIAVLTRTKVGLLQARRLRNEEGSREGVFDQEAEALEFLRAPF